MKIFELENKLLPETTKELVAERNKIADEHPLVVNNSLYFIENNMRKDLATPELIEAKKIYNLLHPEAARIHNIKIKEKLARKS